MFLSELLSLNRTLWKPIVEFLEENPLILDRLIEDPSQASVELIPPLANVKKGKLKLMTPHLSKAQQKSNQAAEKVRKSWGERQVVPWTKEVLLPALLNFLGTGLVDVQSLRQAAQSEIFLKRQKDRDDLEAVANRLHDTFQTRQTPSVYPDLETAVQAVWFLNEGWFIQRQMFLFPFKEALLNRDQWERDPSLVVGNFRAGLLDTARSWLIELEGHQIPIYFVRNLQPSPPETGEFRMGWFPQWRAIVVHPEGFAFMARRASDPVAYVDGIVGDNLPEEIRHASDYLRVQASGKEAISHERFPYEFSDKRVSKHGQSFLRALLNETDRWWDPLGERGQKARRLLREGIYELSGQLTSTALAQDPRKMIREQIPHLSATGMGRYQVSSSLLIFLLAHQLKMERLPDLTPAHWLEICAQDQWKQWRVSLAEQEAGVAPERIRPALKDVYPREYNGIPIDEPPFPEIRADGTLAPRIAAGLEEMLRRLESPHPEMEEMDLKRRQEQRAADRAV